MDAFIEYSDEMTLKRYGRAVVPTNTRDACTAPTEAQIGDIGIICQ